MIARSLTLLMVVGLVTLTTPMASAVEDCKWIEVETSVVEASATSTSFGTDGVAEKIKQYVCEGSIDTVTVGTWNDDGPLCTTGGLASCKEADVCESGALAHTWTKRDADGNVVWTGRVCPRDNPPKKGPTIVDIQNDFKNVPIPASAIVVQPPEGETLVNLPTIFSTVAAQFPAERTVVGVKVMYKIKPESYVWHHGDDTKQATASPGLTWSEQVDESLLITHVYEQTAEELAVSVDTTWSAEYSIDEGKNWQPVGVTVTKVGEDETLDVLEAKPTLVS